ncbi:hypothetical protein QCA50_009280 [Cerrena zonata]|uniref:Uncharacterized protein n=1 Tax=Cerrena zonata TaxID=2478898 RepID=A0AAW0GEG7_9APHY
MFPSPSNFYAPQEWPSGVGMTPIHANVPQYFMNMLPSAGPVPPNGARLQQVSEQAQQSQQNQQNQNIPSNQQGMGSPLQYMGPFNTSMGGQGNNYNNPNNPNTNGNDKRFNK